VDVGIRALGWRDFWGSFFEGSFVNWAFFEVSSVFLGAKRTSGGNVMVFGAHVCGVDTHPTLRI